MRRIDYVIGVLRQIDNDAADFVLMKYELGELNPPGMSNEMTRNERLDYSIVCSFFTWCGTPQGHDYWKEINNRYYTLVSNPSFKLNIKTKKGNQL